MGIPTFPQMQARPEAAAAAAAAAALPESVVAAARCWLPVEADRRRWVRRVRRARRVQREQWVLQDQ